MKQATLKFFAFAFLWCSVNVVYGQVATYPYAEDFEAGAGAWTSGGTNSSWALGTPAMATINYAASGTQAWATGSLTTTYNGSEDSYIQALFDFSTLTAPTLSADIWIESEFSWDGMQFQSSIDGGLSWQTVGTVGDVDNWYNDTSVNGLGDGLGWTGRNNGLGATNGYQTARHDLTGLAGQSSVLLRFHFGSDSSVNDDGAAVDNIEVYDLVCDAPYDITVDNETAVGFDITGATDLVPSATYDFEIVEVGMQRTGIATVTGVTLPYTYTGGAVTTQYEAYILGSCGSAWSGPSPRITTLASCPNPSGFSASNLTDVTADLAWTAGGTESLWDIELVAGGGTATGIPTLDDLPANTYTLTGLSPNTAYSVFLRADCDGLTGTDESQWIGPVNFSTACTAIAAPYSEDFTTATISGGFIGDFSNCWSQGANATPLWLAEDATGGNENSTNTGPFYDNTTFGVSGGTYMYLETSSGAAGSQGELVSPMFDISGVTTPIMSFYTHMFGATIGTLDVEVNDGSGYVNVFSLSGSQQVAGDEAWTLQEIDLCDFVGAAAIQVKFIGTRGTSFTGDISIDDFGIADAGACPSVEDITIANVTDQGADITWGSFPSCVSATYQIDVSDGINTTTLTGQTSPVSLTGLGLGTQYFVIVTPECAGGVADGSSFYTLNCDPVAQCTYTLTMYDFADGVSADGWDPANYVEIVTGNQVNTYTLAPGTYSPPSTGTTVITFGACPGEIVQAEYFGTPQDGGEVWTLSGPNGFSFNGAPANQPRLNIVACPTCPPAFNETAATSCADEITINWDNGAAYDSSEVVFTYGGFPFSFQEFSGTIDAATTATGSYTYTGAGWGPGTSVTYDLITYCAPANPGDPAEASQISGSFVSGNCLCSEQCSYTFTTSDFDGFDGGASFDIFIGGVLVHNIDQPDGTPVVYVLSTCPGESLAVNFNPGSFDGEIGLDIVSSSTGASVYTATSHAGVSGQVFAETTCPTCANVTLGNCENVATNTLEFTWTANAGELNWNVELVPAGSTPTGIATAAVTDTFYTAVGLNSDTCYDLYIQSDCASSGGIGTGDYVGPMTCCTTKDYCGGDAFTDPAGPTANYVPGVNETTIICPEVAGDFVSVVFSEFEVEDRGTSTTCWDNLFIYDGNAVGVNEIAPADLGVGPNTAGSGTGFCWDSASNTGTGDLTCLTIYSTDASGCLTFDFVTDASVAEAGWIATISCGPAATCFIPNELNNINPTQDGAEISWVDANTSGTPDFNIEVVDVSAGGLPTGVATLTSVGASPYTITGLNPETSYCVYVQADCGGGDVSDWSVCETCFTTLATCPPPTSLAVANLSEMSAEVSWVDGSSAAQYDVEWGVSGFVPGTGTLISAATNPTTITGLTAETAYDFYVQNICVVGADSSAFAGPFTFTTTKVPPPAPVGVVCTTPPGTSANVYSENFDNLSAWTLANVGGNSWSTDNNNTGSGNTGPSGPQASNAYAYYEASGSAATDTAWATSPVIDLTAGLDDAELSFYLHAYGADLDACTFEVQVSNDGFATWTTEFAWSGQFQSDELDAWVPVGVNLAAYVGGTLQIRLMITDVPGFTGDLAVDEMVLTACGNFCPDPSLLSVSNITPNQADLSWIENGTSTDWDIEYGPNGFAPGSGTVVNVTSNPYTLTGLTEQTVYQFYVTSGCGSAQVGPSSFLTACNPYVVTTETCENLDSGLPACYSQDAGDDRNWSFGTTTPSTGTGPQAGDHTSGTGQFAYIETSGAPVGDVAILNAGTYDVAALTAPAVSLWYDMFGAQIGTLDIEISNDGGATWINVFTLSGDQGSGWNEALADLSGVLTGTSFDLRIVGTTNGSFAGDISIDDICVKELPLCLDPTALTCGMSTTSDITISWTDNNGGASTYDVEYVAAGGTPTGVATTTGISGTSHTETGLTSNTPADFYVRANCGADLSAWVGPLTCATSQDFCGGDIFSDPGGPTADYPTNSNETTVICPDNAGDVVTVTFTEFSTENTGTGCWDGLTIFDSNMAGTNAISPAAFGFPAGAGNQWCWDRDDFTPSGSGDLLGLSFTSTDASGCMTFLFQSDGSVVREGFQATVVCAPPPSCLAPAFGTCSSISDSEIQISFTDNALNSVDFDLEVVLAGATPTGTPTNVGIGSTTYTVAGLMADTEYDIYYRTDCGAIDGASTWSGPTTCTTLCLPYVGEVCEDFQGGLPNCYSQDVNDDVNWFFGTSTPSTGTGPQNGDHTTGSGTFAYLEASGATAGTQAILNAGVYDLSGLTNPGISLWYDMLGAQIGSLAIELNDGSGWVTGFSVSGNQGGGWTEAIVSLNALGINSPFSLRIVGTHGGSFAGDIAIDDICSIDLPPPPANDSLANAEFIAIGTGKPCTSGTAGSLYLASQDDEASTPAISFQCGAVGGHNDVWYKVEVPASGRVYVDFPTMPGANMFTELYAGPDQASMAYLDLSCDAVHPKVYPAPGSDPSAALTPGDTLWIRAWDAGNNDLGAFEICVTDPVPANYTCSSAQFVAATQFNGATGYDAADLACAYGGPVCTGTAAEIVWFSFTAEDENDVIQAGVHPALTPGFPTGFDAAIEVFDACSGTSLGCYNNYPADQLERVMVGGLIPGNTYVYSVHHAGGGVLANGSFHTTHKTFADAKLRAPWCGATNLDLDDVIQSERDDVNELYTFTPVQVPAYGFEISQGGTVLATVDNMAYDGFYVNLGTIPGLIYGQTYDVRVRHQVKLNVNGAQGNHWSDYGPICTITFGAAPVTQVQASYCTGASDYYLSENLLADPLTGATDYRFTFDDGVNAPIVYTSNNYSVQLYQVPGLQYATSYSVTVEALLAGGWTAPGGSCTINLNVKPENVGLLNSSCNGTYTAPSSDFILADNVLGAEYWEFRFTPLGGGAPFSVIHPNLSLTLDGSIPQLTPGAVTYDVDVRVFAGSVWGDYSSVCPVTVIYTPLPAAPMQSGTNGSIKLADATDVTIYPNPNAGDNFVLALGNMDEEVQKVLVEIVDLTGKTVHTEQFANSGSQASKIIEFDSPLATGMYFVNVYLNDERIVKKITVE